MKCVLFLFGLVISMSVNAAVTPVKMTWPESVVKNLNSKTLRETFCVKGAGYKTQTACDHFSKTKANLNVKLKSARVEGKSLFLSTGKSQVEIQMTANPNQFVINRKTIDLQDYATTEEYLSALRKALPQVAQGSFWVNAAYASEDVLEVMTEATALMTYTTIDSVWCAAAQRFVNACDINLASAPEKTQWDYITKKIKNKTPLNSDDLRWVEQDADNLRVSSAQMRELVAKLERQDVQKRLQSCPSVSKPQLANAREDVRKCHEVLRLKNALLRDIPVNAQADLAGAPQFRKELVEWMEYITTEESKAKVPNVRLDAPPVQ